MGKGLLNKLKIGFAGLGLMGFSYFNSLNNLQAQTTADYQQNDKDIYEFYKQKQENLYINYYETEKSIKARYSQKKDSIYNIYQNYYKKKIGVEDKNNSLEFFLPDSLMDGFRKKVDSLDSVFNPEKENLYNNYKQKKDSISIQCNQKIYKDYHSPKEDNILENILKDFLGEYRIDTLYLERLNLEGSTTDTFEVYKTPINYFGDIHDGGFGMDDHQNKIEIWENRELAKWLKNLGERKRNSLKKSILEKEGEITFGYLWNLRRKLDKNYPKEPVKVPGTDSHYIPQKLKKEEKQILHEVAKKLLERDWTDVGLHEEMYILCKNHDMPPKDFFTLCYRVLINKERGPRLASFMLEIGKEKVAGLLKKA